jgi:glycosyltransferase involved in cell wall biosynthesis
MKLSILIPTIPNRKKLLDRLTGELYRQKVECNAMDAVQIICYDRMDINIGEKRNIMLKRAEGEYIAFIDDDDMVTDCYVKKQLDVANSGMDCGQLRGLYFENGVFDRPFIHSTSVKEWYTAPEAHYRNTNHLNCTKRSIMLQVPFPEISWGEDHKQSKSLLDSGLIKSQYEMQETIYLYYKRK